MAQRSKYATLDAVIVEAVRSCPGRYGASHSYVVNYGAVRAFAREYAEPVCSLVSSRLQALRARGRVQNNGVSGDGCQWFAAP